MSSRFLSAATAALTPYTPGEQPKDAGLIKLNTNECPYPPSPLVDEAVRSFDCDTLRLYPDPEATALTEEMAAFYGLSPDQVLCCGGSDEALAFAFMAFCARGSSVFFPDITYGFYPVYAELFALKAVEIPLREDFTLAPEDYRGKQGVLFIANPNAPTGMALTPEQIEELLCQDRDRLVVVDEAYVDFAPGYSSVELIGRYDNLLVIRTFSKSRALAGMRLGAAFGDAQLIAGMNRIKYSVNPYNLDRVSMAVGIAAIRDQALFGGVIVRINATRERVADRLNAYGFTVLPSQANFLFARHPRRSGADLCAALRERGILVRHFKRPRIKDFVRISIGTDRDMDTFLRVVKGL